MPDISVPNIESTPVREQDYVEENEVFIQQVKDVISMPEYDKEVAKNIQDPDDVELPTEVVNQMRKYVSWIASTYQDNPFHNFEVRQTALRLHVQLDILFLTIQILLSFFKARRPCGTVCWKAHVTDCRSSGAYGCS